MPDLKLRRLFDIRVRRVSLVDRPANKQSFVLVKMDKGDESMEELKAVLEKLEKAFNSMVSELKTQGEEITEIKKSLGDKITLAKAADAIEDEIAEIEKAGRKIAGSTMSRLKTLHATLSAIIAEAGGSDDDKGGKLDKNKTGTMDDFLKGLKGDDKKQETEIDKNLVAGIAAAVKAALEKKDEKGDEKPGEKKDDKTK